MQVREISNGWIYTQNETGISATRVFIDYLGDEQDANLVDLPVIGDIYECNSDYEDFFSDDVETTFATLFCRRIKQKKYGDIKVSNIYYCYYTNEITDPSQYDTTGINESVDINTLPITVESGGEYVLVTKEQNTEETTWLWEGTGLPVYQGTAKNVITDSFRLTRIIKKEAFVGMIQTIIDCIGKLNDDAFEIGGQTCELGTLIFSGGNISQIIDYNDAAKYKVELLFEYRTVMNGSRTGGTTAYPYDGWNWIINSKTGTWDLPQRSDGSFMYGFADFSYLLDN